MTTPPSPAEPLEAETLYLRLLAAVREGCPAAEPPPAIIGIHSGGAWIAERLQADLQAERGIAISLGFLSSAFHRDDYAERGLRASAGQSTQIDFAIEGADILLVDDILYTGRTVRAALNELFDYGRPRRVRLATLLDRGGRELPVQPDFLGQALALEPGRQFVLERDGHGRLQLAVEAVELIEPHRNNRS